MVSLKRLDHVSVAVKSIRKALDFFQGVLGLRVIKGPTTGYDGSFRYLELDAGGVKLELIEPASHDSFLHKFLEERGEGLHHLTFEVDDLDETLRQLEEMGMTIVGRTDEDPEWKIAFIHPKSSYGVLIQLFQLKRA